MSNKNLYQLQKWMQDAIMNPTILDNVPENILTSSKNLTSITGLRIYNRAYKIKLVEILHKEYKVLSNTLGKDLFNKFAIAYLDKYPSKSYSLNTLGDKFPQFLKETRPKDTNATWSNLIIDIASLERTLFYLYDLPGSEKKILPKPELLSLNSQIIPTPCLRLLTFKSPVNKYFSKLKVKKELITESNKETFLVVNRKDYKIKLYKLSQQEFNVLNKLVKGFKVNKAIQNISNKPEILKTIHKWMSHGFFIEINNQKLNNY